MKMSKALCNVVFFAAVWLISRAAAQEPLISLREKTVITALHAEGTQVYECSPGIGTTEPEALTWQFREPIATLFLNGKVTGRHYAGPSWQYADDSAVKGKLIASAPGLTANDIPSVELEVVEHRGDGILSAANTVQRINTKGGVAHGTCERAGDIRSVPYSADYVFLRNND